MNISSKWLAQYVKVDCDVATLCDKLTMAGIEVEAVETVGGVPSGVVVGKILERAPHCNSDHLSVCKVFDGKDTIQIVCGAPNCDADKTIALATIGTVFRSGEENFEIKKSKIRGVESFGMMCSGEELGINHDDSGLMILDDGLEAGMPLAKLYPSDSQIELEVTPNRPDCLSMWGVARDVSCLFGVDAKLPELNVPSCTPAPARLVTVEAPDLCLRYIGRVIRGVKVKESPEWLKERLISVGLRPINNVVDVTNFVLMELGQPLHAFDLSLLAGGRVIARRAKKGEHLVTLDGKDLVLDEANLVIADEKQPMALAGVMGGERSGVTEKTTDILLESAVFFSSNIRSTSRKLGISSDSSYRFERGVDFDMADYASDRAAQLIMELAEGKELTAKVDVSQARPTEPVIKCRFEKIRALIGIEISNEQIVTIFRKLHLKVSEVTQDSCVVTAPLFRLDLTREADLAEEVARINGLDAIPVLPVSGKLVSSIAKDAYVKTQKLRDELVGLGLYECIHYSMESEKQALSDRRFQAADLMQLKNPLSLELAILRPSLWGVMLATIERNISRRNLNFRLFEIGRVFCANPEIYAEERLECCIAISGAKHPERYGEERKENYDFFDLKGLVETWFSERGYVAYSFEPAENGNFKKGLCAEVKLNGRGVGFIGEVAPDLTRGFRSSCSIFMALFDAEALLKAKPKSILYQPYSQFPATARDVAFVCKSDLSCATVIDFIRRSGVKNLESVELFDIFEDEKLTKEGKKSMAYTVTFRDPERTLTDSEVNSAFEKLRQALSCKLQVELR